MTDPFKVKVLDGMRREGLTVRRILRVYPVRDIGDLIEVLFVTPDDKAGTVWVDAIGVVQIGPVSGFGG